MASSRVAPRTRDAPSVHREYLTGPNMERCGVCMHPGITWQVSCCAKGKRWICDDCRSVVCKHCNAEPEDHLTELSLDSDDCDETDLGYCEPEPEVDPAGKCLLLFDLNGTLGFQPRQEGRLQGSHVANVDSSELPEGYHGFASRFYHRQHSRVLLELLQQNRMRCDWRFYTTKTWKNAVPMAQAVLRHDLRIEAVPDGDAPKLRLNGSTSHCGSFVWLFDQEYCKFIPHDADAHGTDKYQHGDTGGLWVFELTSIEPVVASEGYRRIVVVAGSQRKLSNLPQHSRLPCDDYTEALVLGPESEESLLHVWNGVASIISNESVEGH